MYIYIYVYIYIYITREIKCTRVFLGVKKKLKQLMLCTSLHIYVYENTIYIQKVINKKSHIDMGLVYTNACQRVCTLHAIACILTHTNTHTKKRRKKCLSLIFELFSVDCVHVIFEVCNEPVCRLLDFLACNISCTEVQDMSVTHTKTN